ncbi:ABC transporter substrate-binding protein [Microbacterium phosphatis]|uniref:ABC transporter substrate-binding protein n=1 Tax=Microbacterium phosphatis TaxID=3140248 RepID=UPI00314039E5
MKRRMIRTAVAAAAVVGTTLALTACTGGSGPAEGEDDGKLTVFAQEGPDGKLADNVFTKTVADKFDITFDWKVTTRDSAAAAEARQVGLASGEYPDAYFLINYIDGFSRSEQLKYGKQGVLIPLEDLIDEYAPNLKKRLEEEPDWKQSMTAPDGHIYSITQWSECYHCSAQEKLWMNSDWLEALGLTQPTTTDELRAVLEAFKNDDPNGNGKADEIPLTTQADHSAVDYLMNAFTYAPLHGGARPAPLVLEDGKAALAAESDKWREGLTYIAGLAADGLLDTAAFTQNGEALRAVGDAAGDPILGSALVLHPYEFVSPNAEDGRDTQYDAVPPLKGPDGTQFATKMSPVNQIGMFALTNKSSEDDRKKAMQIIDYLVTDEGDRLGAMGPEGQAWVEAEPGDKALDPELEPTFKPLAYDEKWNAAWRSMGQYWDSAEYRNAQVVTGDPYTPDGYERRLFDATTPYEPFFPGDDVLFPTEKIWPDDETATELADLQTNITSYVNQAQAEFITGQRDIADDGAWDAYKADLEQLGLPRYLELMQAGYDAIG